MTETTEKITCILRKHFRHKLFAQFLNTLHSNILNDIDENFHQISGIQKNFSLLTYNIVIYYNILIPICQQTIYHLNRQHTVFEVIMLVSTDNDIS